MCLRGGWFFFKAANSCDKAIAKVIARVFTHGAKIRTETSFLFSSSVPFVELTVMKSRFIAFLTCCKWP